MMLVIQARLLRSATWYSIRPHEMQTLFGAHRLGKMPLFPLRQGEMWQRAGRRGTGAHGVWPD